MQLNFHTHPSATLHTLYHLTLPSQTRFISPRTSILVVSSPGDFLPLVCILSHVCVTSTVSRHSYPPHPSASNPFNHFSSTYIQSKHRLLSLASHLVWVPHSHFLDPQPTSPSTNNLPLFIIYRPHLFTYVYGTQHPILTSPSLWLETFSFSTFFVCRPGLSFSSLRSSVRMFPLTVRRPPCRIVCSYNNGISFYTLAGPVCGCSRLVL